MKNKVILEEKRKIIREYIKQNPTCTYLEIKKKTKLKVERYYKNMKYAYLDAEVNLSKNLSKRNKKEQKEEVIKYIRSNPSCTVTDIRNNTQICLSRIFKNIENAYKTANIPYKKKENREGVRNPDVLKRCKKYEKAVITIISQFGEIEEQKVIKNKRIDCILTTNYTKFVIEIKDFRGRNNITMSQIKQIKRYMDLTNIKNGVIVCPKESFPKQKNSRNLYIGLKNIQILSPEDFSGDVV